MNLNILTPESEVFNGDIISVKVPSTDGPFQILKNHAPIVAALVNGTVEVKTVSGEISKYTIEKGFVEVLNNKVNILVQGLVRI